MKKTNRILSLMLAILLVVGMLPMNVMTVFAASMTVSVDMPSGETVTLDVEPADSIENVKQKMQDKTGLKPETISLYFEDKLLEDGRTLADYNIQSGSALKLTLLAPEDTGETYTLTIKYAIEDSNGVKIGTEIADKVITGIAPGTVIDLSDYWPDQMSVTDSNGTTCWFLNHSKDSDNKDSHSGRLFYWVADKNETIYAHYENWHAPYELTLDPNGGTVNCQKILCLQHPFIYLSSEGQLIPVRDGYKFLGWSLDKNELSDQHVVVEDSGTLYAIWEKLPSVQVGMTTLYDGEYTTDGRSTTTTKPESGGYAYFRDGVLTLNNFTYSGGGNDYAAIYSVYPLTIKVEGRNSITRVVTATDTDTLIVLRGIWVRSGELKIIGDNKEDFLEVIVNGHDNTAAHAVNGNSEGVIIENCTLEAKSATGGAGLYVAGDVTITGADVLGSSGNIRVNQDTFGIYAATLKVKDSDVVAVAEDNSNDGANGLWIAGSTGRLIFESGSIVAETSNVSDDSYAINIKTGDVTLPAAYWMRTSASGEYVNGTWDGANVGPYIELTTTEHHTCDYTYNVNGFTITESCTCGHTATAEIKEDFTSPAIYNGNGYKAKVVYSDNWAGDKVTELKYYKEQINDGNLVSECIDAGDYLAVLTVEGVTAELMFTIDQKEPVISMKPTVSNIVVNSKLSDISLNSGTVLGIGDAELKGEFSWKEPTAVMDTVGPQTVKVEFTPEDENYRVKTFDLEVNVVNCDTTSGEHDFTEQMNDADEHWTVCARCQAEKPNSREAHKGGTATCQTKAKCSECGEEYGDYGAHNWDADWTTDSEKHWHKCLNSGCTEIKDDNPHSGGSATCKDLAKCEFCDMAYGELGAHGDTEIKDKKDATCTTEGYTGDTYCTVCGKKLESGTAIAKTAHTYENGKCTVCNEEDPDHVPDTPPTGDDSQLLLWIVLLLLSTMGITALAVFSRKRRT